MAELDIQLFHSLKPARVASRRSSIGTASGKRNLCAGSYWSDGIPNVIGSRLWRRELPLEVYSFS
ncbi:MAG: hypothetical protein DME60_02940 [Verrucomicrobia bacterium]|nr:MAG: hypothetical protein DME60_02940 [Verrucomicrobiota bacterium]